MNAAVQGRDERGKPTRGTKAEAASSRSCGAQAAAAFATSSSLNALDERSRHLYSTPSRRVRRRPRPTETSRQAHGHAEPRDGSNRDGHRCHRGQGRPRAATSSGSARYERSTAHGPARPMARPRSTVRRIARASREVELDLESPNRYRGLRSTATKRTGTKPRDHALSAKAISTMGGALAVRVRATRKPCASLLRKNTPLSQIRANRAYG